MQSSRSINNSCRSNPAGVRADSRNGAGLGTNKFGRDEIARLAYLCWQNEGCPAGRDLGYWLEAEGQLRATWHLLAAASNAAEAAHAIEETRLRDTALALAHYPLA